MTASTPKWMNLDPPVLALDDGRKHVLTNDEVNAINAALATGRPLLVRGEPGCGKSQLARAAAKKLERPFLRFVVDVQTESRDFLYDVDALGRLARARGGVDSGKGVEELEEERFTRPGPLWWALNWNSGVERWGLNPSAREDASTQICERYAAPPKWTPKEGVVLLVDEIDKGDPSVPNGLLAALGDGWFEAPGGEEIRRAPEQAAPLIVITTNAERTLPAAFLRRCLVLHLSLPKEREALVQFLAARGEAQVEGLREFDFALSDDKDPYVEIAERVAAARARVEARNLQPPGVAEYVDLLSAIKGLLKNRDQVRLPVGQSEVLTGRQLTVRAILDQLERYHLDKHPEHLLG